MSDSPIKLFAFLHNHNTHREGENIRHIFQEADAFSSTLSNVVFHVNIVTGKIDLCTAKLKIPQNRVKFSSIPMINPPARWSKAFSELPFTV